ncbi:MAG: DUF4433 domain-containing protein [Polyangiaceae bacterium]
MFQGVRTSATNPAIFHITHVDNLAGILASGLCADSVRIQNHLVSTNIGYSHIKQRRLNRKVPVADGGCLGDYVPFYFCPRSVMLYVISRGHQDYAGGQDSIIHLVSDMSTAGFGRRWAFTDRHAELAHAVYYEDAPSLGQVDWAVMNRRHWAESDVKERRQAEFLVSRHVPWSAFSLIGVRSTEVAEKVALIVGGAPRVEVRPDWYY